jgi:RNA recognition motif. (a.k.a. RRM, RBD, or RNP domain)
MTKTNEFKGYAYFDFIDEPEATKAAKQLNQKLVG